MSYADTWRAAINETCRYEGLTQDQLRAALAGFGIEEKPVCPNGEMGYLRADFEPVWKALGIA
jgi:hypothetical protein